MSEGRLDDITTHWSLLRVAHDAPSTLAAPARAALVLKYASAIQRYVHAMVRNASDAEDLAQDVVVRLLDGDFAGADRSRGRFRSLLKGAVRNMVRNHWDRERRRAATGGDAGERAAESSGETPTPDQMWNESWRRSLLDLAWRALESFERAHEGNVYHQLLELRAEEPDLDSEALAVRLSASTGREINAAACRQQLRRARLRFAQLLVEEVARSLDSASPASVETELRELGLLEHVEDFLPDDWATSGTLR